MKEEHKDIKVEFRNERRSFLKKAAYSAPALIAMGQLVKPVSIHAESVIDPPPGEAAAAQQSSASGGAFDSGL